MSTTLRQLATLLGRHQRRRWVLLMALAVFVSGFEMVGATLVYLLIGLAAAPNEPLDLPLIGDYLGSVSGSDSSQLRFVLIGIALFFMIRVPLQVANAYLQRRVAENTGARLSIALTERYLSLPYSAHLTRNTADFIRTSHQAVQELINSAFIPLIMVGTEFILVVGLGSLLIWISPAAAALAIGIIGGVAFLILLIIQPRLRRLGTTVHSSQFYTLRTLQEALVGIRDVKMLGKESFFALQYGRHRRRLARARYLRFAVNQIPASLIETALVGFIIAFLAISVTGDEGAVEALPILGLFAYAGLRIQPSVQRIVRGLNDIKYSATPIEEIHNEVTRDASTDGNAGTGEPLRLTRKIALSSVSFKYPNTSVATLNEVSLDIGRGEQVGICGPTGGGKTTLVDVIAGLLKPDMGTVHVDDQLLDGRERDWHQNVGLVSQNVFLIDDTVERNIALGAHDAEIDRDALQHSVALAQLSEMIDSLPDGLETRVGDRGVRLSGGQRQRIAIARALYRGPEVLILDEGTAALDNLTEAALMAAIESLRGNMTIVVVAHRLSTLRGSDRIFYLEAGRISGEGTFTYLRQSHAGFRSLLEASSQN